MFWKIKVFFLRLMEYILWWPYRVFQFLCWLFFIHHPRGRLVFIRWMVGLFLKGIDLLPVPLLVETIMDIVKGKTRGLTDDEKKIALSVFGKSIQYSLVGIDADSWPVKKGRAQAYVTLHTINIFNSVPDHILIHELTHIWQYKKHGSLYITEALYAQRWGGGYNYGGLEALVTHKERGLRAFNFEQQAEIVEDYYRSNFSNDYNSYIREIRSRTGASKKDIV